MPPANSKFEEAKASRVRGLEELDLLGECALRAHLPAKSPQFSKKSEKLSLNSLQNKKYDFPPQMKQPSENSADLSVSKANLNSMNVTNDSNLVANADVVAKQEVIEKPSRAIEDVKIANLFVPLTSIKPGLI